MAEWLYVPPIDMGWDAEAKVNSLDNVNHIPGGGTKVVENRPIKWKAEPKVKSIDKEHLKLLRSQSPELTDKTKKIKLPPNIPTENVKNVEVTNKGVYMLVSKEKIKANPKVHSLENKDYQPKESNVQIYDKKLYWEKRSKVDTLENLDYTPRQREIRLHSEKLN